MPRLLFRANFQIASDDLLFNATDVIPDVTFCFFEVFATFYYFPFKVAEFTRNQEPLLKTARELFFVPRPGVFIGEGVFNG